MNVLWFVLEVPTRTGAGKPGNCATGFTPGTILELKLGYVIANQVKLRTSPRKVMPSTAEWHRLISGGTFGTPLSRGAVHYLDDVLSCHLGTGA